MLSARAYSFRQKSKLAVSLSWIGGYINAVALLALGTVVSHVTGSATNVGRTLVAGDSAGLAFFAWLIGMFWIGAVASAVMTEGARRRGLRSKYVLPMAIEAALLLLLALGLEWEGGIPTRGTAMRYVMTGMAALAMGIQNATVTRISGGVVRTTHLTGILTDFGLEGVQLLYWWKDRMAKRRWERAGRVLKISRRHPSLLRLALLASIAGSFVFGAAAGSFAYFQRPSAALIPPVCLLALIIFVDWKRPIADVRELDLLNDPELKLHGILKELLPPGLGLYRFSCPRTGSVHRAPNFQLWVDRLPREWDVIILAISPLTRFDGNAIMDLEAAVRKLHESNRKLIISGLTPAQFRALDALGVTDVMDVQNLCPDLEFGVARAMTVLHELRETRGERREPLTPAL